MQSQLKQKPGKFLSLIDFQKNDNSKSNNVDCPLENEKDKE